MLIDRGEPREAVGRRRRRRRPRARVGERGRDHAVEARVHVGLRGHAVRDEERRRDAGCGLVGGVAAVAVGERPGRLVRLFFYLFFIFWTTAKVSVREAREANHK